MFKIFKKITALAMAAVTAGALGLSAFAEDSTSVDELIVSNTETVQTDATTAFLSNGLKLGKTYNIESKALPDYVLNVNVGTNNINICTEDYTTKQRFKIISDDSSYKIEALCSSSAMVLDAYKPLTDGCNADIWANNDDDAQQLVITGDNVSGYVIKLKSNTLLALTVVELSNGGNVQFKTYNGSDTQKWLFNSPSYSLTRSPNYNAQNKTLWCWAASTRLAAGDNGNGFNPEIDTLPQMLTDTTGLHKTFFGQGTYNGVTRYFVDGVQYAIVKKCHKNDLNEIGSVDDMEMALEYVNPNNINYERVGDPTVILPENLYDDFRTEVQKGHYIVAGFGKKRDSSATPYFGHVVVITKYDPSTSKYTYYDPWYGRNDEIVGDKIFKYLNSVAGNGTCAMEYYFYMA